jgi:hypothetical protein
LLDVSDLVKFSKFKPDATGANGLLESARQIVLTTKPAGELGPGSSGSSGQSDAPDLAAGPNLSKNGNYQQLEVRA